MNIKKLLVDIEMPREIIEEIILKHKNINYEKLNDIIEDLYNPKKWEDILKNLKNRFNEDPNGFKMLAFMLECAIRAWDKYQEKQISYDIYVETMKFFKRAVEEYKIQKDRYGFNQEWWCVRQVSLHIFKLGELEYERVKEKNENFLSIHIPSGADMRIEKLRKSYLKARKFMSEYYPEYANSKMFCDSWLLAPELKELLSKDSKIIKFQNFFVIESTKYDNDGYLNYIYGKKTIPIEKLPEKTTLQKKVKNHLLNGGSIGWTKGILKKKPFL